MAAERLLNAAEMSRIRPNYWPTWNLGDSSALFPVGIALEEIMPRAIKSQEAATSIVMIVLTAAICLMLIVTAMELPIRLIH